MSRYVVFTFAGLILLLQSCNNFSRERYYHFTGEAQGTTYSIKVMTDNPSDMKEAIDSIFASIDAVFSTYNPESEVSRINSSRDLEIPISSWMEYILKHSFDIYDETEGYFDPTVIPIVQYWKMNDELIPHKMDSIRQFVGLKKVKIKDGILFKSDGRIQFDFNAIVPGFTTDVIGDYFYKRGMVNYLVEVGGEVNARGRNEKSKVWVVGIDRPDTSNTGEGERVLMNTISLDNKSLATSGNYRKWKKSGSGSIIGHIVNPITGISENTNIASVTVVMQDCIFADAYATAFVVMGFEKAKQFLSTKESVRAYFIVSDENGNLSEWESHTGLVNKGLKE